MIFQYVAIQIKISNLYYTRLILSDVIRVSNTPQLCARAHTSRLQRWRVAGNVWKICSAWNFNPAPPASEASSRLTTCYRSVVIFLYKFYGNIVYLLA